MGNKLSEPIKVGNLTFKNMILFLKVRFPTLIGSDNLFPIFFLRSALFLMSFKLTYLRLHA